MEGKGLWGGREDGRGPGKPPAFGTISGRCFLLEVDKRRVCTAGAGSSIKNQVHL